MSDHLSHLALDRLLAGRAGPAEQQHRSDCQRCAERLARLDRDDAAFLARFPTLEALHRRGASAQLQPSRALFWTWGWRLGLAGVAVAAALALLTIVSPGGRLGLAPREGGVRSKGGSIVELAVRRAGRDLVFEEGMRLRAGDVLAFRYTTPQPWLLLCSLERSGKVNVYLTDPSRRHSMQIRPGRDVQLGLGVELDEYVGPERVIAFLSREPLEVEAVRQAVAQRFGSLAGAARDRLDLGPLPLNAEQLSWLIDKGRRE